MREAVDRVPFRTAPRCHLAEKLAGAEVLVNGRKVLRVLDRPCRHASPLAEGHHLSFIDNCLGCTEALTADRGHDLINRYITAFLETHLLGDDRYAHFLSEDQPPDAHVAAR